MKAEKNPNLTESFEEAKKTLVRVVENYKNLYGKSELDQRKLVPEAYQSLIWSVFPSEFLPELLKMKYQAPLNFEALQAYTKQNKSLILDHTDPEQTRSSEATTSTADPGHLPFYPLDFQHGERHAFKFSEEYVQDGHAEGV